MTLSTEMMLALGGLAVLGAVAYVWKRKHQSNVEPELPAKWPLASRVLVNSTEEKVWAWLREIFYDHEVMVKTPVLRFTALLDKEKSNASPKDKAKAKAEAEHWLERLSGIYTTFTICNTMGKVVGCVDVPGKTPPSKASRELKESLLSDCGIAYIVVTPSALPTLSAMRAAFLGELPVDSMPQSSSLQGVDTTFRADLKSFTIQPVKQKPAPQKVQRKGF